MERIAISSPVDRRAEHVGSLKRTHLLFASIVSLRKGLERRVSWVKNQSVNPAPVVS